ncbi:peroxisomal membrane protein 11C-like [Uloborus diversus]|uniref:peroxisomal membrane protein 11C-like n=1 Tax=Uloborus diversus TaxID=327109 RepID=UPI002409A1DB|nr:peroxisomal membrane protein 11C-like [Uloborus diversus]
MNSLIYLLNSYTGRDSIVRTMSYFSLYLSSQTSGRCSRKLKMISEELSYCRLILRLFDDLPMLRFTLSYGLGREEKSVLLQFLGVLKNLIDQMYYPIEHITWAAEKQLIKLNTATLNVTGSALWALSSYISMIRALILMTILQRKTVGLKNITIHEEIVKEQLELLLSAFKDVADVVIAINYLPHGSLLWAGKLNTKQIGVFGIVSSLIRVLLLVRNSAKTETHKLK